MFSEKVIAQMAAFFVAKEGDEIPILKLIKLLYLSDRESLDLFGEPISFDRMVSLPHGPILSRSLDYINGLIPSQAGGWDSWIDARAGNDVGLLRDVTRESLSELSDADLHALENVWARFGHMDKWQISKYTHDNCPEWRDPQGGQLPIYYKDVFSALGKEDLAEELTENLRGHNREERIFDRL